MLCIAGWVCQHACSANQGPNGERVNKSFACWQSRPGIGRAGAHTHHTAHGKQVGPLTHSTALHPDTLEVDHPQARHTVNGSAVAHIYASILHDF